MDEDSLFSMDELQQEGVVAMSNDISLQILNLLKEIKFDIDKLKNGQTRIESRLEKLEHGNALQPSPSSSSLLSPIENPQLIKPLAYVTVKDELDPTKLHELVLLRKDLDEFLGASSLQESVKKLLKHFHSIAELRTFTLSGKSRGSKKTANEAPGTSSSETSTIEQLPIIEVKLIQAAILRKYPVAVAAREIPSLVDEHVKRQAKDCKSKITDVLQYFKSNYDEHGVRIIKENEKKKKKNTKSVNSEIPSKKSNVENLQ